MNADEAARCVQIAEKKLSEAQTNECLEQAQKFLSKALALDSSLASKTKEIQRKIRERKERGFSRSNVSREGVDDAQRGSGQRKTNDGRRNQASTSERSEQRQQPTAPVVKKGTPEQEKIMREIMQNKQDYYKVLGVERSANEAEIKKAYRKLAVKIHPDKCQGSGAEEAFKVVSKAFACLSDAEKKAGYDRYGSEEGARQGFGGMRANGGAQHNPFGGFQGEDIDPREIFNMFFGGGMPGVRFQTFGGGANGFHSQHQRARQSQQRQQQQRTGQQQQQQRGRQDTPEDIASAFARNFMQMIPILLFLFLWAFSPSPEVHYQLFPDSPNQGYRTLMSTKKLEVPFYVKNQQQFEKHFVPGTYNRQRMEQTIERDYQGMLENSCLFERGTKERMLRSYSREQREKGQNYEMKHCDKLRDLRPKYR